MNNKFDTLIKVAGKVIKIVGAAVATGVVLANSAQTGMESFKDGIKKINDIKNE